MYQIIVTNNLERTANKLIKGNIPFAYENNYESTPVITFRYGNLDYVRNILFKTTYLYIYAKQDEK
jgi:hypothetical protein